MALSLEPAIVFDNGTRGGAETSDFSEFLDFDNLPDTNFSCVGKVIGGYYADLETNCQMFHVCTIGQADEPMDIRFLCLNGTVFDQETRVCERIDEVDCSKSEQFYSLNLELYGNSGPILEETPEIAPETEPPSIIIKSTTTTSTTTSTTTKKPAVRPTNTPYHSTGSPSVTTTSSRSQIISNHHHFPVNSPDIRFNPEEINISLNADAPPDIRTKHYLQQGFSEGSEEVVNDNRDSDERQNVEVQKHDRPRVGSSTTHKTVYNFNDSDKGKSSDSAEVDFGFSSEDYETEPPFQRQQQFLIQTNSFRHSQSFPPNVNHNGNHEQYHHEHFPSSTVKQNDNFQEPAHTTLRTIYYHSFKPAEVHQHHHYTHHRTERPPHRVQIPIPLLPTLPPLTFSSPAPFSLQRRVETKRYTKDHQAPPRIIISASASVSDASGRRLNYSLGTIGTAQILKTAPSSYDDYKDSDVQLDPFYHDVPKLDQRRRKRRSAIENEQKINPFDIIKNEKEAVDVLKFLFTWYQSHQATATMPPLTSPVSPDLIQLINNAAEDGATESSENQFPESVEQSSTELSKPAYKNSQLFKKNSRFSIIGGYRNLDTRQRPDHKDASKLVNHSIPNVAYQRIPEVSSNVADNNTNGNFELKEKVAVADTTIFNDKEEYVFNPFDYVDDNYEGSVYKEDSLETKEELSTENEATAKDNKKINNANENSSIDSKTKSELYKYLQVDNGSNFHIPLTTNKYDQDVNSNITDKHESDDQKYPIKELSKSNSTQILNKTEENSVVTTSTPSIYSMTETQIPKKKSGRRGRGRQRQRNDNASERQNEIRNTFSHAVRNLRRNDKSPAAGPSRQRSRGRGFSRFNGNYYSSTPTTTTPSIKSYIFAQNIPETSTFERSFHQEEITSIIPSLPEGHTNKNFNAVFEYETTTTEIEHSEKPAFITEPPVSNDYSENSPTDRIEALGHFTILLHNKFSVDDSKERKSEEHEKNGQDPSLIATENKIENQETTTQPISLISNENHKLENISTETVTIKEENYNNANISEVNYADITDANYISKHSSHHEAFENVSTDDSENNPTDRIKPLGHFTILLHNRFSTDDSKQEKTGEHEKNGRYPSLIATENKIEKHETTTEPISPISNENHKLENISTETVTIKEEKYNDSYITEVNYADVADANYISKHSNQYEEAFEHVSANDSENNPTDRIKPLGHFTIVLHNRFSVDDSEHKKTGEHEKNSQDPSLITTENKTENHETTTQPISLISNKNLKLDNISTETIKEEKFNDSNITEVNYADANYSKHLNHHEAFEDERELKSVDTTSDDSNYLIKLLRYFAETALSSHEEKLASNASEKTFFGENRSRIANVEIVPIQNVTEYKTNILELEIDDVTKHSLENRSKLPTLKQLYQNTNNLLDSKERTGEVHTSEFEIPHISDKTKPELSPINKNLTEKSLVVTAFPENEATITTPEHPESFESTTNSAYQLVTESERLFDTKEHDQNVKPTRNYFDDVPELSTTEKLVPNMITTIPSTTESATNIWTLPDLSEKSETTDTITVELTTVPYEYRPRSNVKSDPFEYHYDKSPFEKPHSIEEPNVEKQKSTFDISYDVTHINNLPSKTSSEESKTIDSAENLQKFIDEVEASTKSIVAKNEVSKLSLTESSDFLISDRTTTIKNLSDEEGNEGESESPITLDVKHNATEIVFVKDLEMPKSTLSDFTTDMPTTVPAKAPGILISSHLLQVSEETSTSEPDDNILTTSTKPYHTRKARPPKRIPHTNPRKQFGRHRFSTELFTNKPLNYVEQTRNLPSRNKNFKITDAPLHRSATPTKSELKKVSLYTTPLSYKHTRYPTKVSKNYVFNCFGKEKNKFYADPRDCRLFHYCTQGYSKNQLLDLKFVCDRKTFFDDEKLICTKMKPTRCL